MFRPIIGARTLCHQPLIGNANVLEPKGNHLIAIVGELFHECRLAFISEMHPHFVISGVGIQKTTKSAT